MTQQHSITPSNLSSQAWAVLEAAYQAPDGRNATRQCVAAALRAAADQIENLYCDGDVEDSPGIVFALRQLMLIANELMDNTDAQDAARYRWIKAQKKLGDSHQQNLWRSLD